MGSDHRPGQALDAKGQRVQWANTALGVGVGYTLLALTDAVR